MGLYRVLHAQQTPLLYLVRFVCQLFQPAVVMYNFVEGLFARHVLGLWLMRMFVKFVEDLVGQLFTLMVACSWSSIPCTSRALWASYYYFLVIMQLHFEGMVRQLLLYLGGHAVDLFARRVLCADGGGM